MTSAPIFFTVKIHLTLLCPQGRRFTSHHSADHRCLASRRLLSFHKRQFNKHNLDQHLLLHWLWQETLHSECKYMHTARAHSGVVKRKPIDRAWKEFFSWFICCYIDFLFALEDRQQGKGNAIFLTFIHSFKVYLLRDYEVEALWIHGGAKQTKVPPSRRLYSSEMQKKTPVNIPSIFCTPKQGSPYHRHIYGLWPLKNQAAQQGVCNKQWVKLHLYL